jgi:predicted transcriptional regulator
MAKLIESEERFIMSKAKQQVTVRTGNAEDFFARARKAAQRADRGEAIQASVTLSFEDPQRMFTVLSQARRRLMQEILHEPKTIQQLTQDLQRERSMVTKDVGLLEKMGLIVSERHINPGHGIQKMVRAIAPRIEMVAVMS